MSMEYVTRKLGDETTPRAFAFGADYNPEQWPEDIWEEDIRLMQEAGVNLVSVGIFSWALLEPEEGRYDFGWLDRILDLLHAGGIRVDLANATASPPAWWVRKYPQALPVTVDGVRLGFGSRQSFSHHAQEYRRAAAALTQAIADRYAGHPVVVLWHVHNEYGCHNIPDYSAQAEAPFRRWLQKRYGDLEELNTAWGTAFWSQHYYDWEEIQPPRRSGTFINPCQQLDWARFTSDSLLECFSAEAQILRKASPHPVTTNFMGFMPNVHQPTDYWRWAEEQDVVSNDHYLIAEDPRNFQELAMTADLTRSLAQGKPWLLMEHSTSAVNWQNRNIAKAPGELLRNSLQHIARGADGALFFQWRASAAGGEKFHSAMLPHAGTDTKVWREVLELGRSLKAIAEVAGSTVAPAPVAILHDTDSRWGRELDSHPHNELDGIAETRRWHDAFYRAGIGTDFRRSTDDLSSYRVVIAPMQYVMTDAGRANLEAFVHSGGRLVVTFFSAIVDQNEHIHLGGYPGPLRELLGVRIEEFFPLRQDETIELGRFGQGREWSELGRTTTARSLADYLSGAVQGSPAVTVNDFGAGQAYYVGTQLNREGLDEVLGLIGADIAPAVSGLPAEVEAVKRMREGQEWLFVINHGTQQVETALNGFELLSGTELNGELRLQAGRTAVVRLDKIRLDTGDAHAR
ncbi:beta-galactosidase [Psychromicrobium silvestre]|uniref:Beta-galactosidase n=1 Tax=Psychromicrobium silvestre TaxID=1645614 RepID=A0A7Y9LU28_9MICC|nr:beta-galactosidase [Psychromicrobium silvestre]NYE95596.1 beta-galactosidase [Psychromicrobium silvestre]